MCRNIRVLHNFAPPTTPDEIRAAALQYVRKVGGISKPSEADAAAVERAVDEVARTTARLLSTLTTRGSVRTRQGERERAALRWRKRETRLIDR